MRKYAQVSAWHSLSSATVSNEGKQMFFLSLTYKLSAKVHSLLFCIANGFLDAFP